MDYLAKVKAFAHAANVVALLVGWVYLSVLAEQPGTQFSMPFIWLLLIVPGGIAAFVFYGWWGTGAVLGAYALLCIVRRITER